MATTASDVAGLSRETLLRAYRIMRTSREFEERLQAEFELGEIPGFLHLSTGQEAIPAAVCCQLEDSDWVTGTHRGHSQAIAKGCDVKAMMAEIYGRATGSCHGKGGSPHITQVGQKYLGATGSVGGGGPLICGVGLSARVRGSGQVGVCFVGDGSTSQGVFLESLNLAAVWRLPVVFVVENNGYSESTPVEYHRAGKDSVERAAGFGLPGALVDGHDFFAVYEAVHAALAAARRGQPSLVECVVTRYRGHFEGDQQTYRPPGEVEEARRTRDCLDGFARRVTGAGVLTPAELAAVDEEVATLIDEAVEQARTAPFPALTELVSDVYTSN